MHKVIKLFLFIILIIGLFSGCAKKDDVIKIGAILPLTGDAAAYGQCAKNSLELAKSEVNNKDGINGKKIEIIYEDSQAKSDLALSAANKLIEINNVKIIIGAMSSTEVLALAPILNQKKVILISPAATNHEISNAGDYIFRTIVSDIYDGIAMAKFISKDKNIKTVSLFNITEAGPQGVATAFKDEFIKRGGEILNEEKCIRGDINFKTQILKIQSNNPDALYFALFPRESELFIKQVKELGINIPLFSHQLMDDPSLIQKTGDASNGIIFTSTKNISNTENEEQEKFNKNYLMKFGQEPLSFGSNSYDALMITYNAMINNGISVDEIKKGLYEIENYNGASGTFSVDKNGDIEQELILKTIKNGKIITYSD